MLWSCIKPILALILAAAYWLFTSSPKSQSAGSEDLQQRQQRRAKQSASVSHNLRRFLALLPLLGKHRSDSSMLALTYSSVRLTATKRFGIWSAGSDRRVLQIAALHFLTSTALSALSHHAGPCFALQSNAALCKHSLNAMVNFEFGRSVIHLHFTGLKSLETSLQPYWSRTSLH